MTISSRILVFGWCLDSNNRDQSNQANNHVTNIQNIEGVALFLPVWLTSYFFIHYYLYQKHPLGTEINMSTESDALELRYQLKKFLNHSNRIKESWVWIGAIWEIEINLINKDAESK